MDKEEGSESTSNAGGYGEVYPTEDQDGALQTVEESFSSRPELDGIDREQAPPTERFGETAIDSENDFCACSARGKVAASGSDSDEEERCPLCGKLIATEHSNDTRSDQQFTDSRPPSADGTEPADRLFREAFVNRLNFLPENAETSSQSNNSSMEQSIGLDSSTSRQIPTVVGQARIPSEGDWHSPPQMPPIPTLFKFFTTVYRHAGANGLLVALYLVTFDHFEEVTFSRWLEDIRPYVAIIGDQHSRQEDKGPFHTQSIQGYVDVSFLQTHRPFRVPDLPPTNRVPLIRIKSLNQYRIPGPIATVFVECPPAEPGEICPPHGHLKMDLNFDGNARRNMLVPIWVTLVVPIWVTLLC